MKPRDNPDLQVWSGGFPSSATDVAAADFFPWVWSDGADSGHAPSAVVADASFSSPGAEPDALQNGPTDDIVALLQGENPDGDLSHPYPTPPMYPTLRRPPRAAARRRRSLPCPWRRQPCRLPME